MHEIEGIRAERRFRRQKEGDAKGRVVHGKAYYLKPFVKLKIFVNALVAL